MNRAPSIISINHACSCKDKESYRTPMKAMAFDSRMIRGARIFLFVLNIVSLILSVAMIGLSASLYMAGEIATDTQVITILEQMTVSYEISIGTVMTKITMGILVVGIITAMVSLFGFFGAFYRNRPMFILYPFIVVPILGFMLFVMIIWFKLKDQVSYTTKHKMLELLKFYEGKTQTSLTKAWNNLFLWFDCCGVNAQSDMDDFLETKWNTSSRGNQIIPGYCCKDATSITGMNYFSTNCTTSPTPATAYINKGCYKAILYYLQTYNDGFLAISFLLLFTLFTVMTLGLVIVFKRKDRKKPLHALIHEKSFPGTCSEYNTIFAPGSAIATLDEGQRPILDVNLPHSYFSFAPGPTTDFPFNPAYPIYNFNPAQPMSHQFLELLYDCWGRPYYNVCDYPLDLEEKSRTTHRNKDQDRDKHIAAKFDDCVRQDVYLNRDNRGLSSGYINVSHDYPTVTNDNFRDRTREMQLRVPMGYNRFHEDATRKLRRQQLMVHQRYY